MRRYRKSNFKNINNKKTLICLVFIAILLSNSYLLARYSSSLSGFNSAEVAKFIVSLDTSDNVSDNLSLVSSVTTASYTLKVINTSNVSTAYYISLSNVPDGLEVMLDNSGTYLTPINNVITFNNVGSFSASDPNNTHTHVLTFNDPITTSNNGIYSIDINVNVEQVD